MNDQDDPYWRLRDQSPSPEEEICACDGAIAILLADRFSLNPIACARCNGEVPPERIGFDARLAQRLSYWREYHHCFYFLWLDSGEYEEWALRQLLDPLGAVNRLGVEMVGELGKFRKAYLSWFQDESEDSWEPPAACPRCSGHLDIQFERERPQGGSLLVCEECSIALLV